MIGASERAITVYVEDSVRMTSKKASPSAAINHSPRLPLSPLRSNYELEKNDSLSRKGNESADRTQIITTSGVENSTQDLSSYQWPQKLELNRFSSSWGEKIPIVDGEGLWSEDAGPRAKVVRDIGAACERWGFFQVSLF